MSIRVMSHVWEHSRQTEGALLVLLAIADFADDSGRAYPSLETLAAKSRLTKRQVQRVLNALMASGELIRERHGGGRGRLNLYRVVPPTENRDKMSPFQNRDIGDTETETFATRNRDIGASHAISEPSLTVSKNQDAVAAVKPQGSTRARARGDGGFHPLAAFLTTGPPPAAATAARSTFDLPDEVRERLARPPISAHR